MLGWSPNSWGEQITAGRPGICYTDPGAQLPTGLEKGRKEVAKVAWATHLEQHDFPECSLEDTEITKGG